jgi:hypothetical protein
MERGRTIITIVCITVILLTFVGQVINHFFQPSPVEIARDYCLKEGFPAESLILVGYRVDPDRGYRRRTPLDSIRNQPSDERERMATVEFHAKGADLQQVEVLLRQTGLLFHSWKAVGISISALAEER